MTEITNFSNNYNRVFTVVEWRLIKMKKICWTLISVGIIMTVLYSIGKNSYEIFCFGIPYVIAAIGLPYCIKKDYMYPITFLLLFVTLYNVIYFILIVFNIDLLSSKWRIPFQYVVPAVLGNLVQYSYSKKRILKDSGKVRGQGSD